MAGLHHEGQFIQSESEMRLSKARVTSYRSIRDTGWFEVEKMKTIMVGSNEAGKTAVLQALQQINAPADIPKFEALRDYPRSSYNDITIGKVDPSHITVVEAYFSLDQEDKDLVPDRYKDCTYYRSTKLDNEKTHTLYGAPGVPTYSVLKKDLQRLCAHLDKQSIKAAEGANAVAMPTEGLSTLTAKWNDDTSIEGENATALALWLEKNYHFVDEKNVDEEARYEKLATSAKIAETRDSILGILGKRLPIFVLFNNYFRVRPLIHLAHLAQRLETKVLDDAQYDYGNQCLLKLLGFSARQLSDLGKAVEPTAGNVAALKAYRDQLDKRTYQLNSASVRLSLLCRVFRGSDRQTCQRHIALG